MMVKIVSAIDFHKTVILLSNGDKSFVKKYM